MANPLSGQLPATGLQMADVDPPTDKSPSSLDEVREAMPRLSGGKAACICNISAELLKSGDEALICELHAVLTAVEHSVTIPLTGRGGWQPRYVSGQPHNEPISFLSPAFPSTAGAPTRLHTTQNAYFVA